MKLGLIFHCSQFLYVNLFSGQLIITFTNDEGSRRLTANAMYNSNLKPVHSHEILRDFAAKGRLFTMYRDMTSHQISHMRKLIMTALSFRTGLIPSREDRWRIVGVINWFWILEEKGIWPWLSSIYFGDLDVSEPTKCLSKVGHCVEFFLATMADKAAGIRSHDRGNGFYLQM